MSNRLLLRFAEVVSSLYPICSIKQECQHFRVINSGFNCFAWSPGSAQKLPAVVSNRWISAPSPADLPKAARNLCINAGPVPVFYLSYLFRRKK